VDDDLQFTALGCGKKASIRPDKRTARCRSLGFWPSAYRVAYRGERITISKRGKPMAVLIPATELTPEEHLRKVEGWLDPDDPFFGAIGEIVSDRDKHVPRLFEMDQE